MGSDVSEKAFRIKLEFTPAPPAYATSSKYMVLVKPEECQTIQDLEVLVIRKFEYSKDTVISLSVDGFCLPSLESIYLLSRDDIVQVNVVQEVIKRRKSKKRHSKSGSDIKNQEIKSSPMKTPDTEPVNDEATLQNSITKSTQRVKKSKKKHKLSRPLVDTDNSVGVNFPKVERIKRKKKRHLDNIKSPMPCKRQKIHIPSADEAAGLQPTPTSNIKTEHDDKKSPKFHQKQNTRCIPNCNEKFSGTNSPDKASNHSKSHLIQDHSIKSSTMVLSNNTEKVSSSQSRPSPVISAATPNLICKTDQVIDNTKINHHELKRTFPTIAKCINGSKSHIKFDSSSSSSEEESDQKPNTPKLSTWLGTAKASINHMKQPWSAKNLKDPGVSTNVSSIYTNPFIPTQTPSQSAANVQVNRKLEKNYVAMLPSTWPPRVGDVIAYKVLELSFDYTPIVSEYKEAKIEQVMSKCSSPIGVDSIQVELLTPKTTIKRDGGRYEMDLGEETDDEPPDITAVLEWQTLLQPKLVR